MRASARHKDASPGGLSTLIFFKSRRVPGPLSEHLRGKWCSTHGLACAYSSVDHSGSFPVLRKQLQERRAPKCTFSTRFRFRCYVVVSFALLTECLQDRSRSPLANVLDSIRQWSHCRKTMEYCTTDIKKHKGMAFQCTTEHDGKSGTPRRREELLVCLALRQETLLSQCMSQTHYLGLDLSRSLLLSSKKLVDFS